MAQIERERETSVAEEEVDTMVFVPPDWYGKNGPRKRERLIYRSIYEVGKQVQTDLGFLPPQPEEEDDQFMEEEGSDKRNRKRKKNNQDEDEKRNPNFDSDDNDDDSDVGVKMQSWDMSIKEGDKFDIPTLHSNSSTEYLIKNNREKVLICSLICLFINYSHGYYNLLVVAVFD